MRLEIRGRNREHSLLPTPALGEAAIFVDGEETYSGRSTRRYGCEIKDRQDLLVLSSTPESKGPWHEFIGQGSHVVRDAAGTELARITYGGFLGLRRTIEWKGDSFPCPRQRVVELPGAVIVLDLAKRMARLEVSESTHVQAFLGIAFYLWVRSDFESTS